MRTEKHKGPATEIGHLRIGSIVTDRRRGGLTVTYKILAKSPGAIYVARTEQVSITDDSVMPPVDRIEERTTKTHIAPGTRLADMEPQR